MDKTTGLVIQKQRELYLKSLSESFGTSCSELSMMCVHKEVNVPSVDWLMSTTTNYRFSWCSGCFSHVVMPLYFWLKRNKRILGSQGSTPFMGYTRSVKLRSAEEISTGILLSPNPYNSSHFSLSFTQFNMFLSSLPATLSYFHSSSSSILDCLLEISWLHFIHHSQFEYTINHI